MREIKTQSAKETKKIARILAKDLIKRQKTHAQVLALEGNLGAGKTTFVQGFAEALGVKEKVLSPTFVLMKIYKIPRSQTFKHLVHTDCYRLDSPKDLLHLGFKKILTDKDAIILIEWADKIKKLIPQNAIWIKFRHGKPPLTRTILLRYGKEI